MTRASRTPNNASAAQRRPVEFPLGAPTSPGRNVAPGVPGHLQSSRVAETAPNRAKQCGEPGGIHGGAARERSHHGPWHRPGAAQWCARWRPVRAKTVPNRYHGRSLGQPGKNYLGIGQRSRRVILTKDLALCRIAPFGIFCEPTSHPGEQFCWPRPWGHPGTPSAAQ